MELRNREMFTIPALELAPMLVGKLLCRRLDSGEVLRLRITETECYMSEDDKACHAHKGRTKRTEILYDKGGVAYVYLIYGMHWLMNVVAGEENFPQAVLIRCCEGKNGPGKLTKAMQIDGSFNKEDLTTSQRIWLEDDGYCANLKTAPRVGIDYAGEYWRAIEWRFIDNDK